MGRRLSTHNSRILLQLYFFWQNRIHAAEEQLLIRFFRTENLLKAHSDFRLQPETPSAR